MLTPGPSGPATVAPSRGDVVSTLVLHARVEAQAPVAITAPFRGTFTVDGDAIRYVAADGSTGSLDVPAGVAVGPARTGGEADVPANYPIADAVVTEFALVADLDAAALYRLYTTPGQTRGQVDEGPGPFDCPLADPVPTAMAPGADGGPAMLRLVCVVPPDVRVFAGMSGVMAVQTGAAHDVLLLPVEAVAGSADRGEVTVVRPDGELETRPVELGLTDGAMIEIRSGLGEADQVVVPAGGIRAAGS